MSLLGLVLNKNQGVENQSVEGNDSVLTWVHAVEKPAAYLVGSITIVWNVQRTAGFFTY
jgi:hypothetical protein